MSTFQNKIAVVIGATSVGGIGEAIARDLARLGAKVVVAGRRVAQAEALAREIDGAACACDLTDEASIEALMTFAATRVGRDGIDIVVNAGGQAPAGFLNDVTEAELVQTARTNLVGPVLAIKHAGRHLRRGGVFLQFTSMTAQQPTPCTGAYAVCKAGVEQAIRIAALEYAPKGIRYLGIAPAMLITPMTEFLNNDFTRKAVASVTPLGRMVEVGDAVSAARFLVSDDCFETGHIMPLTGGAMITRALLPNEFFPPA